MYRFKVRMNEIPGYGLGSLLHSMTFQTRMELATCDFHSFIIPIIKPIYAIEIYYNSKLSGQIENAAFCCHNIL
jgi:hypothetical protein